MEKERKEKYSQAVKTHQENQTSKLNPTIGFDRSYKDASGVSPIRCRMNIDLYGTGDGMGEFNPILVAGNRGTEKKDGSNSRVSPSPVRKDTKPPSGKPG